VLINLTLGIPPNFSRFQRSVEIIAGDEAIKEKLRKNYSFYKQRGYPLTMHNLKT
jgi:DNA polymerase-3 subunit chi